MVFLACLFGAKIGLIATVLISKSYRGLNVVKETVYMGCQRGVGNTVKTMPASFNAPCTIIGIPGSLVFPMMSASRRLYLQKEVFQYFSSGGLVL